MGAQTDFHLVVNVFPFGMMIHFLRGQRHARHKSKGFRKIVKAEGAAKGVIFFNPHGKELKDEVLFVPDFLIRHFNNELHTG